DLDSNQFPDENAGSFNAGMRGKKGSPYEGGHRVPFIMRYPAGGYSGGKEIHDLASYVDFMPTLLTMCGIDTNPPTAFHGKSLVPLIEQGDAGEFTERIIVSDTQRIAYPMKWRKSSTMRGKWRLVHGKELYNIESDPGQRNDVADDFPDLVNELRSGYDAWWELVSEQFDRDIPIALGGDDDTVKITTHDIRNPSCNCAWNQAQVRSGHVCSGYWEVDVRAPGTYRFELRRWPEEAGYALTAGIDGDDIEWRKDAVPVRNTGHYSGGEAIPIKWAQLKIGGKSHQCEIDETSSAAAFEVSLETGMDHLEAAFYDKAEQTIAPYYVYVSKK
ncbi:MAG: sulfatase-like hydrolase/transferase, partial [Spirochaetales bacterium]|nr:sulfatase-like hydrolase/transferase [Spirochaetales bacterium]